MEAASKKEAGGDAEHVLIFIWPYQTPGKKLIHINKSS